MLSEPLRISGLGDLLFQEREGRLETSTDGLTWIDSGPALPGMATPVSREQGLEYVLALTNAFRSWLDHGDVNLDSVLETANTLVEQRDGYRLQVLALTNAFRSWLDHGDVNRYRQEVVAILGGS